VGVPGLIPDYYSSLAPFRETFARGCPVLMYHKLGPRPRGTRLKGLYVGEALFRRQLRELAAAGYSTIALDGLAAANFPSRRIALTFDDGFENVLRYGVGSLAQYGFKATQYLVADRLGQVNDWEVREGEVPERLMDKEQVRDWLAAGHAIGAHTLTHPRLTQVSPAQAREEIAGSKKKLEDLFGLPMREFCYPYGDWNPAMRDEVAAAGYSAACTTERGVNSAGADRLAYKRYMARYASRNWRNALLAIRGWLAG